MEGTPRVCGHHFLRTKKKGTLCGKPAPKELDGTNYCLVHYRMAVTDQAKNASFMSSQPVDVPVKREDVKTYATKKESPEASSSSEEEEDKYEVLDSGRRRGVKRSSAQISSKKREDAQLDWMNEKCLRDIKKTLGLLDP